MWPNELVQIYVYMFLVGTTKAVFIETCGQERYEENVEFDDIVWNDIVLEIQSVVTRIRLLVNNNSKAI